MSLKEDLFIDVNRLDVEWLQQPMLYAKYGELLVEAQEKYNKLKDKLDYIKGKLFHAIKTDPASYGIDKPTDTAIMTKISTIPEYRKVLRNLANAKKEVDYLQVALRAVEQRKYTLENLVRLLSMEYFASPENPRLNTMELLAEKIVERRLLDENLEFVSINTHIRDRLNKNKNQD